MEKCGHQIVLKNFTFAAKHNWMENSGHQFFFQESKWKEGVWGRTGDFSANELS